MKINIVHNLQRIHEEMVITTIDKMKCKLILRFEFQEECMEETIVEKSINEEEMEKIVKDKENISKKEGKEGTSKEDCMEGTFNVEGIEETEGVVIKTEDMKETIQESQRITQYDHVDGENDEEVNILCLFILIL